MAPQWLPQNIRKRVFKYILSRLPLFSNIDLENIETVSIGTTQTTLKLTNVDINTDFILPATSDSEANIASLIQVLLPGVVIQQGQIETLNLHLSVLNSGTGNGIQIEGENVTLTVSLKHNDLIDDVTKSFHYSDYIRDDKDKERILSELVARTTADFANSVLVDINKDQDTMGSYDNFEDSNERDNKQSHNLFSENELMKSITSHQHPNLSSSLLSDSTSTINQSESTDDDDSDSQSGYGMGDFTSVISRVADVALSQVSFSLKNIKVTLLIEDGKKTTKLDLTIDSFQFGTDDNGVRTASVNGLALSTILTTSNDDNLENTSNSAYSKSIYHDTESYNPSLAESMFFSTAEANSLYMSAMSATQSPPNINSLSQRLANASIHAPISEAITIASLDEFSVNFKGLDFSHISINCGILDISLDQFPDVLLPCLEVIRSHKVRDESKREKLSKSSPLKTDSKQRNKSTNKEFKAENPTTKKNSIPPEDLPTVSEGFHISYAFIRQLNFNLSLSNLSNIQDTKNTKTKEPLTITLSLVVKEIECQMKDSHDIFFNIGDFIILKTDNSILPPMEEYLFCFKTGKKSDSQGQEQSCHIISGHALLNPKKQNTVKFTIPYPASLTASLNDLFMIKESLQIFQPLIDSFSLFSNDSPKENIVEKVPMVLLGMTNTLDLKLYSVDETRKRILAEVLIFPMSIEGNGYVEIPQISIKLASTNTIDIEDISVFYLQNNNNKHSITTSSLKSKLNIESVQNLLNIFTEEQNLWNKKHSFADQYIQSMKIQYKKLLGNPSNPQPHKEDYYEAKKSSVESSSSSKSIKFGHMELVVTFPSKLGTITIDLGDVIISKIFTANKFPQQSASPNSNEFSFKIAKLIVIRDMSDVDEKLGHLSLVYNIHEKFNNNTPLIKLKLDSNFIPLSAELTNFAIEYHVRLLDLFEKSVDGNSKDGTIPIKTSKKTMPISIPITLKDFSIGLSPLHLPSHGIIIINSGRSRLTLNEEIFGQLSVNTKINNGGFYLIDDKHENRYDTEATHKLSSKKSQKNTLHSWFKEQGYSLIASFSDANIQIDLKNPIYPLRCTVLDLQVGSLLMQSSADSTHLLMQFFNDLKPTFDLPQFEERYKINTPLSSFSKDLLRDLDEDHFSPENLQRNQMDLKRGKNGMFEANADFICDDVPTNLEFVESYYADHPARSSQWISAAAAIAGTGTSSFSSGGSINTSYSNTDILLEEDLSDLVSRSGVGHSNSNSILGGSLSQRQSNVVEFNNKASRKLGSFEQRAQSHESMLNFTEDHFGKPAAANDQKKKSKPHHKNLSSSENEILESTTHSESFISTVTSNSIDTSGVGDSASEYDQEPSMIINFWIGSVIWDLHDGYDWVYTREMISNAVYQVEAEARDLQRELTNSARNKPHSSAKPSKVSFSSIQSDDDDDDDDDDIDNRTVMGVESSSPRNKSIPSIKENSESRDEVVGEMLFQSIYIGASMHEGHSNLRKRINKAIDNDDQSDTTSQLSMSPNIYPQSNSPSRSSTQYGSNMSQTSRLSRRSDRKTPLKLKRSKVHKVRISLKGINGSLQVFAGITDPLPEDFLSRSEYESEKSLLLNRIALKVTDFEIIDNIQTSTWNKFLTYMRSIGPREAGSSMLKLQIETVKPVASLPTAELIINVHVLPLRLHVDQDTLDFITRFFEFKDDRFDILIDQVLQTELPFIQKIDVRDVPVKLDYKPKKVDYVGLRSGHTTEFMNFFILDEAEMTLRHVVLHGISGFPKMSKQLNDVWMPDIKKNQLGDVLAGLAPVRSIVKLGSGFRDLVKIPVEEYQRDGRVVRSIQRGAWHFARNTSTELVKFGAKLAVGTQTVLENAEQAMGGRGSSGRTAPADIKRKSQQDDVSYNSDDAEGSDDGRDYNEPSYESSQSKGKNAGNSNRTANVSLYANQPQGVRQGLQSAFDSLGRNLNIAKDAVSDIRNEAVKSGSAQGAAKAVFKAAPIALIRPMIGATEAMSKTLLGVTNQMDPEQLKDVEEKYRGASPSLKPARNHK